jgi:hypothetical protein
MRHTYPRNGAFMTTESDKQAARASSVASMAQEPEWVVNSIAELGVKIGNRFFWMYKGRSLEYKRGIDEDDGTPLLWRPIGKREFGECCHPVNYADPEKWGTVDIHDGNEWFPVPNARAAPSVSPEMIALAEEGVRLHEPSAPERIVCEELLRLARAAPAQLEENK